MTIWKRGNVKGDLNRLISHVDLTFSDHGIFRFFWRSWAELPGKMYRSNQPFPFQLGNAIQKHNIKSILNLRGERNCSSFFLEKEFCITNNISLYNFPLSSRDLPTKEKILQFFELLDNIEYPCLMHCKSGADRAGLAAVLYLIYKEKYCVSEALKQLSFKHLHLKYAKTGILDFFFAHALEMNKNDHLAFINWIKRGYDKNALKKEFKYNNLLSFFFEKFLSRE